VYNYLQIVEQRLFSSGLHTLGTAPNQEELKGYLDAYFTDLSEREFQQIIADEATNEKLKEGIAIKNLLGQNSEELTNLLRGLNGEYVPPAPGGDLLRDGAGVLPTGRNIHALDPYRMPSPAAYTRGREIAKKLLQQNLTEKGKYPETVAVLLWGLDVIKTKGESLGILLELVGAEPVKEGTGRIVRYELKPLGEIGHGDFGSLVNDQVVEGNWDNDNELAKTWEKRNVFSYGRQDKGQARPEVLQQLLKTSESIIQEIDSVEYGLTDIQEYYGNTGGLKLAAEKQSGKRVMTSFVESFSNDTTPRKLEEVLRLEYRSKLLNPKWANAMVNQGSGGAYEISQRMTALIGWGGTANFSDDWVYDQAADTYAFDAEMAEKLRQANPEAFRNIVGRMLEAQGRGFWQADPDKLEKLQELYQLTDEKLEGVT